ncbi:MAG: cobalt chelatase, partial [Phyllobacteriaceae bacterium]|nr:cobalt chelatase [Phyllobacteriaceae bacterium]
GGIEVIERFMMEDGAPLVSGVIKLNGYLLGSSARGLDESDAGAGAVLLSRLGIPLFNPTIAFSQSVEQWRENPSGLGMQAAWSIAMPEFEGAIEPMVIGALAAHAEYGRYAPIPDRVERFAARVARWLAARAKAPHERRVAFILHNNPCVGAEASVGGGAHLDTLETVSRILGHLKTRGYDVEAPASGKALIDTIMERKAISEFRWTTTDEIVNRGGVLARVDEGLYRTWFDELPHDVQERMSAAWGEPPGRPMGGVPAAMVHRGEILVTGLSFGNAVVLAQPKRGCAGARCDGTVCRILHDPEVPPPHQYVATYKWLSREFGADMLVHVGTHGNLEFLPGKSVGMSEGCFSDIAIDTMPHLYIYNCDNPPEGTAAKRRANAVLVYHMQTVVVPGQLYGDLEALDRLLDDYHKLAEIEPAKAHSVAHLIAEKAAGLQLFDKALTHSEVEEWIGEIHNRVTLLKNTRIPKGMHIFGDVPEGERLSEFVHGIARWDNGPASLRGMIKTASGGAEATWESEIGQAAEARARESVKAFIEADVPLSVSLGELGLDARRLGEIE